VALAHGERSQIDDQIALPHYMTLFAEEQIDDIVMSFDYLNVMFVHMLEEDDAEYFRW